MGQLYLFQRAAFWSQSCCQVCCSRLTRDRGRAAGRGARYPLNNPFFVPFSTDCSKPIYAQRSQAQAVRPVMGKKRSAAQLEALKAGREARQDRASSPVFTEQLTESPALLAYSRDKASTTVPIPKLTCRRARAHAPLPPCPCPNPLTPSPPHHPCRRANQSHHPCCYAQPRPVVRGPHLFSRLWVCSRTLTP